MIAIEDRSPVPARASGQERGRGDRPIGYGWLPVARHHRVPPKEDRRATVVPDAHISAHMHAHLNRRVSMEVLNVATSMGESWHRNPAA